MQSSVGNSVVSESKEKNLDDMYLFQFLFSVIATWCAACLICLYQPFMTIWMGENMLLPIKDVILIGIWFMVDSVQQAYYLYLTATGLWNEMKYSYIFNTCCNLSMNIILGKLMGMTGIILASLLTCIISGCFWQCIILFKNYYKKSARKYIFMQFKYFGIAAVIILCTYYICHFIAYGGIIELALKTCICVVIPSILLFIVYFRNKYFLQSKRLFWKIIHKNK